MRWPVETGASAGTAVASTRVAAIAGLGSALPATAVDSDAIAARLGVPSGWIERRTGIRSRRRAGDGVRVSDLAADALRAALEDARIDAAELDTVLVATLEADDATPNAAPQVAHAVGATGAAAFDVGAACAGFVTSLTVGAALIEAGRGSNIAVVGAEILSRHTNYDDRATAGLFGDGAGAVVLSPSDGGGIGRAVLGSDGGAAPFIVAPRPDGLVRMDGHETFKRAVSTFVANAAEAVAANGLTLDDIDLFVFHQANGRILGAVRDALGIEAERVVDVIADVGNTSAASIPLALAAARDSGQLQPGARLLMGAVGAGFTWGAVVLEWRDE